eukprot:c9120_g1_i1 orf=1-165(-)
MESPLSASHFHGCLPCPPMHTLLSVSLHVFPRTHPTSRGSLQMFAIFEALRRLLQ